MATVTDTQLVEKLASIVGRENVLDRVEGRKKFTGDMSWLSIVAAAKGKQLSRQDAVASPRTAEEVAAILRLANELKVPVTPFGGGSGVQGAANADKGGILLNLRGLNRIRHIDEASLTCTVEAGHICKSFEATLNERGLSFTHYPASTEWATIGGCLAARGSGVLSTKYGKIEEHVLSLEWVTPTGEIVHTPSVPRHAAGPELTQLLIGSEGVLGIITAVTVRLKKLPAKRVFGTFTFGNLKDGIEAGRQIMTTGLRPPVLRLYDQAAATHSLERAVQCGLKDPTMVLMFDGDHASVADAEAKAAFDICKKLGAKDLGSKPAEAWWEKRYVFYYPPFAPELPSIWCTMDVVADFSHITATYDKVTAAMKAAVDPKWNMSLVTHFSHWYEWGSMIYPRFKIPTGPSDLDEAMALHDKIVHDATKAALEAGAVINDHHGVGMRLGRYMKDQLGSAGMNALRGIKKGLDPNGILCPGKLGLQLN
ncbi:MAG TPA: FAD-binding oxidoreductase [Planctomycetota bacterium]|nr:FAD-binding oxidoreductase [Planctomycetota bacterium]